MKTLLHSVLKKALLAGVSFGLALVVAELGLRWFYPKYQYAAESKYERDAERIWSRAPNSDYLRRHPDTGRPHKVIHNNLALRQNRNFTEEDLDLAVNIGIFGDSFTENLRLPAPYSFNEPLDYLLNQGEQRYNVLNFGVDGYGTDQAYLYYKSLKWKNNIREVFYVFSANDLRNLFENQLFYVDDQDQLKRRLPSETSIFTKIVSKFHITYLVVEAVEAVIYGSEDRNKRVDLGLFLEHSRNYHSSELNRMEIDFKFDRETPLLERSLDLFIRILGEWKEEAKRHGARFTVVLLPRENDDKIESLLRESGFSVINLYKAFRDRVPTYDYFDGSRWQFKQDAHWNEAANRLAAKCLYESLAITYDFPKLSSGQVERLLSQYYSAFEVGEQGEAAALISASEKKLEAIRMKYDALVRGGQRY